MKKSQRRKITSQPHALVKKIRRFGQKAGQVGYRVRTAVFGLHKSEVEAGRLPIKLLQRWRVLERRETFRKGGGFQSGVSRYALNKVHQHRGGHSEG
ncbi:MAG: hypothetical protein D6784_07480 [Chloroflexi bacterium]|nr:MAG: hypothetical protein D6784_07480 [Chloroflexota bacterium]